MSDSDSFWSAARAPRYPHSRYLQAAYNRPHLAPPENELNELNELDGPSGDIAALDTVAYAQNRDAIMAEFGGGPRTGEWLGGVEKPAPRPALTAEQMTALGLGFGAHATTGYEPRDDSEYRQAQHYAAGHTALSGPHRDIGSTTRESR